MTLPSQKKQDEKSVAASLNNRRKISHDHHRQRKHLDNVGMFNLRHVQNAHTRQSANFTSRAPRSNRLHVQMNNKRQTVQNQAKGIYSQTRMVSGQHDRRRNYSSSSYNRHSQYLNNRMYMHGQNSRAQTRSRYQNRLNKSLKRRIGDFFLAIFQKSCKVVFRSFRNNPLRSFLLSIFVICSLVLACMYFFNSAIYSGVHVGDLDVSGMDKAAASKAIYDYYSPRVGGADVVVFAGARGKEKYLSEEQHTIKSQDQLSTDEVADNTNHWDVDSKTVGAYVDAAQLAEKAFDVGRSTGGFFAYIASSFFGYCVSPVLSYDDEKLTILVNKIDEVIGTSRVDWNIALNNGHASVTEGHDGYLCDKSELQSQLDSAFLNSNTSERNFVANVHYAPVRIEKNQAEEIANMVNSAIEPGVTFSYLENKWKCNRAKIGSWIETNIENRGDNWYLVPEIALKQFSSDFLSENSNCVNVENLEIRFITEGDQINVHTNMQGVMPQLNDARNSLNEMLFSTQNDGNPNTTTENGGEESIAGSREIEVNAGSVPEYLTLSDAIDSQIVTPISSYSIRFTTGSGTEARNENIRLGCSAINNTVCGANGGAWSFNNTVGDTTPEKGYLAAGSIAEGEYTNTYGGGICQVATTLFNAIFDSCYRITERHNHSLYISSYPKGRDAAIAWNNMDLCWVNETNSDVLIKSYVYADKVTVTLYSVYRSFHVESEIQSEEEGKKYTISVQEDKNLKKGESYIKTKGTDGSKIVVTRKVLDEDGRIITSNIFASSYDPKNEVIVAGPETEVDTERKE